MKRGILNPMLQAALLTAAALVLFTPALRAGTYSFQTLNNNGDPAFNQLLGINNSGTIAGYFGDGSNQPNKGYTLAPPYTQGSYTNENFPNSAQTQVIGINNSNLTVGFWADNSGNNFGFVKNGTAYTNVVDPLTQNNATTGLQMNQLLGVNDKGFAAGFYSDANGANHAYVYNITGGNFISIPGLSNWASDTATGVNNSGLISGSYTDASGATHGFLDNKGAYTSYNDPNGTDTMFFGLNNNGQAVGSYVDANGVTNGFVFNFVNNTWQTVDDPKQSSTTVFGNVNGTTINGINDLGQLVGFYSDGTNVDGFLATSTPEPASFGLLALAGVLGLSLRLKRKRLSA